MRKRYIPKHSTSQYYKLYQRIRNWENDLFQDIIKFIKIGCTKITIWFHNFTNFLSKCLEANDRFWDSFEEKIEDLYEEYVLRRPSTH